MSTAMDMSLDEVISSSGVGKGTNGSKGSKGTKGKGWSRWNRQSEWQPAKTSRDDKLDMSLDDVIGKNEGSSGGKGKSKGKGKEKGGGKDWSYWGGKGKGARDYWPTPARWEDRDHYHRPPPFSRMDTLWSVPPRVERGEWSARRDAARPDPRDRDDQEDDRHIRPAAARGGGGNGWHRIEQSPSTQPSASASPSPEIQKRGRGVVSAGVKRKREDANPKRIKVSNVPRNLDKDEIQEAFEGEAGKVASCVLERQSGTAYTAYLTFFKAESAAKAVKTFHKGQLNEQTITVKFV